MDRSINPGNRGRRSSAGKRQTLKQGYTVRESDRNSTLDISYKELERFVAVLERGGLAEAAKVLGITQQALGRSLTKLEQIVGARLVNRAQGSRTTPTLYGEAFLPYARSQLNGIEHAVHHVQALQGARAGKVAIGIGEVCDIGQVAEAVRHFHHQRPDVEISLLEDYSETLLNQLIEGELDVVLGAMGATGTSPRGVASEYLYSIDDIVVARAQHPVFKLKRPRLRDLQSCTWLVARRRPSDWQLIRETFIAEGLEPPARVIRTDAAMVGAQLMLSDDFLFMISPAMAERSYHGIAQSPLKKVNIDKPTATRHAGLLTIEGRRLSPAATALIDDIRLRFQNLNH